MLAGLTGEELRDLILSIGTQGNQRRLSPVEVAVLIERARMAGESNATIAAASHLEGTSMIGRFLKLLALHPEVQPLVNWGATRATVGFSSAAEIARLRTDDQVEATLAAIAYAFTRMEAKELAQLRLRSGRPVGECIKEIVDMRKQVETIHVLVGHIMDPSVTERLNHMRQKDRDALLLAALDQREPGMAEALSVRLGTTNFVLSTDDDGSDRINRLFGDFESDISELLARKVKADE